MTRQGGVSFDAVARIYEPFEYLTFGGALMRRRLAFLDRCEGARRVLVLGDGDGRFTADLVARCPNVHVTAVDSSGAMLLKLAANVQKKSSGHHYEIKLRCVDARAFNPAKESRESGGPYDRVVTHFFFDCFTTEELDAMIARIAPALTPDAQWIVSDFAIPRGAMRWVARLLVRSLYLAFRLLTGLRITRLPDHFAAMARAGFERTNVQTGLAGALVSEVWAFAAQPSAGHSVGEGSLQ